MKEVRSCPSSPSMRVATRCRWLRTVSALSVVPTGRTSLSSSTVTPNGTSEAHFVSRYSISGATCSLNNPARGLKLSLAEVSQRQRFNRGASTGTSPNGVRNRNEVRPLLHRRLPHAPQRRWSARNAEAWAPTTRS